MRYRVNIDALILVPNPPSDVADFKDDLAWDQLALDSEVKGVGVVGFELRIEHRAIARRSGPVDAGKIRLRQSRRGRRERSSQPIRPDPESRQRTGPAGPQALFSILYVGRIDRALTGDGLHQSRP